jgi:ribosomal-protein-alanine N-acetyltransferase
MIIKLFPMDALDLDAIVEIENEVQQRPWTKTQFFGSLIEGDDAWIALSKRKKHEERSEFLGYFVQKPILDEMELLTIAVKKSAQGKGVGQRLLKAAIGRAKALHMKSVSLEVRESNIVAIRAYIKAGFVIVGCRKNYYLTTQNQREDAFIMRYVIHE